MCVKKQDKNYNQNTTTISIHFVFWLFVNVYMCCCLYAAQRQSQRYWYDKDWLSSGHMYGLSFLEENYSHQNSKKVTAAHQLLGDVHHVFEVLNGLQLKMSILQ